MPVAESLGLIVLAVAVLFWLEGLRARDLAVAAAREACRDEGLQFLDDTVTRHGMRLQRDGDGRLCLERDFAFEYSDTGYNRREGRITLVCGQVSAIYTGPTLLRDVED